jgi:PEP-CTERM motif
MTLTKTLLLTALTAFTASADTLLTYTETMTTSGTLDGTGFTNQLVTIALTGDTNGIMSVGPIFLLSGSASVTVATVGSDTFTDVMAVVDIDGRSIQTAGITDRALSADVLDTANSAFSSYALNTPIGPLSGTSSSTTDKNGFPIPFPTAGGTLILNGPFDGDHPSTFTATATASAPEPGTLAMFGIGIGLLGFGRFGRRVIQQGTAKFKTEGN